MREFAQELPHTAPAEAWQRSVQVAADTPIEPEHEPRVKKNGAGGEAPKAGHPFFWAGYMLVDSGQVPKDQDGALALPGFGTPKKGIPAQPANPPLGRNPPDPNSKPNPQPNAIDRPAAGDGAEVNPPDASAQPVKRTKKAKAPPRARRKKRRRVQARSRPRIRLEPAGWRNTKGSNHRSSTFKKNGPLSNKTTG